VRPFLQTGSWVSILPVSCLTLCPGLPRRPNSFVSTTSSFRWSISVSSPLATAAMLGGNGELLMDGAGNRACLRSGKHGAYLYRRPKKYFNPEYLGQATRCPSQNNQAGRFLRQTIPSKIRPRAVSLTSSGKTNRRNPFLPGLTIIKHGCNSSHHRPQPVAEHKLLMRQSPQGEFRG
jgi:hypothetical protein